MNHYKTEPPWKFLLSASRNSLQSYELSRLSHAANLRKEIGALLDLWMEENSAAMLARWLMEQRERLQQIHEAAIPEKLSRKTAILRPIIFLRIGRSHRRQIETLLEGKAIFRRSIRSSPLVLALTRPRSFGRGVVSAVVCRSGFRSVAPAFPTNASPNHAWRLPPKFFAAAASTRPPQTYVLAALYLLEDANSEGQRRHFGHKMDTAEWHRKLV